MFIGNQSLVSLFLWRLNITKKLRQPIALGHHSPFSFRSWWTFANLVLEATCKLFWLAIKLSRLWEPTLGSHSSLSWSLGNRFFLKFICHVFHSENMPKFLSTSRFYCCSVFLLPYYPSEHFCPHLVCLVFLSDFHCSLWVERRFIFPSGAPMT